MQLARPDNITHQARIEKHFTTEAYFSSFLRRAAALIIDNIILLFFAFSIAAILPEDIIDSMIRESDINYAELITSIQWLASLIYFPIMESLFQATFGKKAMGLKVLKSDGRRISFLRAFSRIAVKQFSYFFLCIGFLIMLFTEKKQTLHDLICSTIVIHEIQRMSIDTSYITNHSN
ncbi:MAG: RDD family protein [Elusimicrobiales bacterium]|nr:RDD family protein [Elusimicrobiales bacterium]